MMMPSYALIPADYGRRVAAYLIDVLFVIVPPGIGSMFAVFLVFVGVPISIWTLLLVVVVGWLLTAGLWNDIVRQGTTGATFGKTRMSLALVGSVTGSQIGIGRAILRLLLAWFFNLLTGGLFLIADLLTPAFNARHQRLVDMLLKTQVVDTRGVAPQGGEGLTGFDVAPPTEHSSDPFA